MLKFKRLFAFALCLTMVATVCACKKNPSDDSSSDYEYEYEYETITDSNADAGSNKSSSNGSKGSNQTKTNGKKKISVSKDLVGTTVKYATWINEFDVESGPVINNFMDETGIKVELVNIPQESYLEKLTAMISAGQSPDVFRENEEWPRLLQIAQPIANSGINVNDSIWDQVVIKFGTVGGKAYLVNTKGSIWSERNMVFYNKKIFEENAITTPAEYMKANNWTWDTFYKCLKDVKNSGVKFGGFVEPDYLANSVGAGIVVYENGKYTNGTKNPKLQEAYSFVAKAVKEKLIDLNLGVGDLAKGNCGLFATGTYGCKSTGYFASMDSDNLGYAMMPKYDKNQSDYTYSSYPLAYGLVNGASNPKGAGVFLQYFLDVDNYKAAGSYDTAFKSKEAQKFYEQITSHEFTAGAGYISATHGAAKLYQKSGRFYLGWEIRSCDPSQVATNIAATSNKADAVCKAANEVIDNTIKKFK